jgi:hypothetical protein
MNDWRSIIDVIRDYLVGAGPMELTFQFSLLFILTAFFIYSVVYRNERVVIVNHIRLIFWLCVFTLLNFLIYRLYWFLLSPSPKWYFLILAAPITITIVLIPWYAALNAFMMTKDQYKTIKDFERDLYTPFNRNAPFIPRTSCHYLYLMLAGSSIVALIASLLQI